MTIPERIPGESQTDYAMRAIREAIVNWELLPGSLVSENKLGEELGVSRLPVREALKKLEKSRIVEIYPQRGTRIAEMNMDLVEESVFLRRVVESAVVELACEIATDEDLDWFDHSLDLQRFYWEKGNLSMMKHTDQAFHRQFYRICNKMQCFEFVCEMEIHFDRFRHLGYMLQSTNELLTDHGNIIRAVKAHDPESAKKYLCYHIDRYRIDIDERNRIAEELLRRGNSK